TRKAKRTSSPPSPVARMICRATPRKPPGRPPIDLCPGTNRPSPSRSAIVVPPPALGRHYVFQPRCSPARGSAPRQLDSCTDRNGRLSPQGGDGGDASELGSQNSP